MQPTLNKKGSPPSASTSDIMLVQESMQGHGLYRGEIDGIPGKQTMQAVRNYKRAHKMPQNNALTEDFIAHLREA